VTGFRASIRAWLLECRAKELGNPPVEPPAHNRLGMARIQFLVRVESLINVGCKYGPNDLPARVWDELVTMALERQFVDRVIDQRRARNQRQEQAMGKARQQTGLPNPGGTIFPTQHPFR
jgi:hypothetical protein